MEIIDEGYGKQAISLVQNQVTVSVGNQPHSFIGRLFCMLITWNHGQGSVHSEVCRVESNLHPFLKELTSNGSKTIITDLPIPSLWVVPVHQPQASSIMHASNLDWRLVSYMILYIFQCHSPKSSHPLPLPQSPKDCSIHQCLFHCLVYRVIVTIFLNSIYMR